MGTGEPVSVNELVRLLGATATVHIAKRPGEPDCTFADIGKIVAMLGWKPDMSFEQGVEIMLRDIASWEHAPLWDPQSIAEATKTWFNYLGRQGVG